MRNENVADRLLGETVIKHVQKRRNNRITETDRQINQGDKHVERRNDGVNNGIEE